MRPTTPPLPNSGIYRLILLAMVATVICGAILAIVGETVAEDRTLSRLGTGMALIGGLIYGFFRWLGIREARRRAAEDRAPSAGDPPAPPEP